MFDILKLTSNPDKFNNEYKIFYYNPEGSSTKRVFKRSIDVEYAEWWREIEATLHCIKKWILLGKVMVINWCKIIQETIDLVSGFVCQFATMVDVSVQTNFSYQSGTEILKIKAAIFKREQM